MATESDPGWEALSRVAAGEAEAFAPLVQSHQERLLRLCERLLGDPEEARDAAQEVFLKAYRNAGDVRPQGQVYTWLYRIAVNHCLNKLRRRKLVRFLRWEAREDAPALDPPDAAADPAAALEARSRWQATRRALAGLPESQRRGGGADPLRRVSPTGRRRKCWGSRRAPSRAGWCGPCGGWRRRRKRELRGFHPREDTMTRGTEEELIRLLHGELASEEARALRARMFREPELAAAYGRLERAWNGLELPPAAAVPPGFAGRVMARARERGRARRLPLLGGGAPLGARLRRPPPCWRAPCWEPAWAGSGPRPRCRHPKRPRRRSTGAIRRTPTTT